MSNSAARLPGEARRQAILDAAMEVFAEKGFGSARTREIARRAGISETLIFRHFRSKAELYESALLQLIESHPAELEIRAPMDANDDYGVLVSIVDHMLHHAGQDSRLLRLGLLSALERIDSDDPPTRTQLDEDRLESALATYLRRRAAEGALAIADPDLTARLYMSAALGFILAQATGVGGPQLDVESDIAASTLARTFLQGIQRSAPERTNR